MTSGRPGGGTAGGVVLPYWGNRPSSEALDIAMAAEELGYEELWIGEMATFDAFALAAVIADRTARISLTVGPLAVHLRRPAALAMGVGSVGELGGRAAHLALGTSSDVVVEAWHGRPRTRPASTLRETVLAVKALLVGERGDFEGRELRTRGFRLRTGPVATDVTVAAFGPAALAVAGELGDRLVINLVTPEVAARLVGSMREAAARAGRPAPPAAAWVVAAVDPGEATLEQVRSGLVSYLAAPGYGEMFAEAGFGSLVQAARDGQHPKELRAAIPLAMVEAVAAVGSAADVRRRLDDYRAAGLDHVAVAPATADDPGGRRTLAALRLP